LRHRHILVNGVLVRAVKQRQARLQRQGVVGFIFEVLSVQTRHHALNHPHRLLHFMP
jgi:hypothetical protein